MEHNYDIDFYIWLCMNHCGQSINYLGYWRYKGELYTINQLYKIYKDETTN